MFSQSRHRAYQWTRQRRRLPRLPRNLYRVLALAVIWLTVAPVATYLVSGQAGGSNQSTTPVATSNPSPVPLTATAPQTADTTATTAQPSGVQGNSPRWATAAVTNNPADVAGSPMVSPKTSDAVLRTTEPNGLAGLVTPRNVSFTAVTTSPQGSMPAITPQTVNTGAPTIVKPDPDLPGIEGSHVWYSGQFNVDINADETLDAVYFVLTVVSSSGAVVALDISSDDADYGETTAGSLSNGATGSGDDERVTSSGTLVRLGAFYGFVVEFPTGPLATRGEQARLVASDAAANDFFGRQAVAISGDTIVVGAFGDDTAGGVDAGSAYVFVRSGATWSQQAKLTANDAPAGDGFGHSVGVSGDTIVVGAWTDDVGSATDAGSAYVFVRNGTTWSQQAKLTASDMASFDHFGWSAAVDGDTIVVGASNDYGTPGSGEAAYVFVRPAGGWTNATETARLTASDAAAGDYFGVSVAVDGDTIVVGAFMDDNSGVNNAGAAYVFVRPAGGWGNATQTAKLIPGDPDPVEAGWFGWGVAVSGDTILVGAQADDIAGVTNVGSAYVFVRPDLGWSGERTQTAKLTASDGAASDDFGSSVAIYGDTIAVTADADDNAAGADAGSVYIFLRPAGGWVSGPETIRRHGSDAGGSRVGWAAGISGDTFVVGSWYGERAYVFTDSASASLRASTWYVATVTSVDLDGDGSTGDTYYAALTDDDSDGIYEKLDLSIGDNVFGEGNLSDGIVDYSATNNSNDERLSAAANVKMGVNTFYFTFDTTPGGAVTPTAWAWGDNGRGQLGDGNQTYRDTPGRVTSLIGVTTVAGGGYHSLSLKPDGTVWAWGWNQSGQVGDGTTTNRTTPVQVSSLTGVITIAWGAWGYSLALKSDGTVWAWGGNGSGQLGDGTTTNRTTPVQVNGLMDIIAITGGGSHSLALKSDGTVWAWGANNYGQLGDGTTTNRTTAVQVSGLTDINAIAGGGYHSLALKSDGTVWAWGDNLYGGLGDGTTVRRSSPIQVSGLTGVVAIAGGGYHSLALKSDGTVWAWGDNWYGVLGDGTTTHRYTPVQVGGITSVTAIAGVGWNHSLALKSDGTVWGWGWNESGQLGDSTTTNRSTPVQVNGLSGVTAIVGGGYHSLALKPDGTVWAWGHNSYGQLGNGIQARREAPIQVGTLTDVSAIAGGGSHSLALKLNGTVWGWGRNESGQVGDGTTADRNTPLQVSSLANVVAIAGGGYHSLALKADGTVWAWGGNVSGQLGDGTTADRTTAVQVSSLNGVTAIAAGVEHSLALKSDGTVWAWGSNWAGQLGDGSTTHRYTPNQVSGLTDVIAIAGGWYHSLALKSDGTVWAWGNNWYGQLGDGTTTDRQTPVPVSDLTGARAIAGGLHSLALKSDGTVWAWGGNGSGQLGDGTTTSRTTPVHVSSLNGVTAITGGGYHSVALKSDGTVWAWGENSLGQLGDGTTTSRTTPVHVSGLTDAAAVAAGSLHSLAVKSALIASATGFSAGWLMGNLTLDANANGNKTDAVDTLYYVLTDLDSDGLYDRLDLSLANDTFTQGGNLENAVVSISDDDERLLASQGLAKDMTLGSQLFVVSFARNPGSSSVTADVTIQAKTWYKGSFTIDVDANGLANDTVSFVLSDTDSDGLYDAMDLSTNDTDYEDGNHANQQTGLNEDETIASSEDVRLGDYYTFTVSFVSNPGGVASVASITSRTWYTGAFTIDSDGDEAADDTAYFVLSDTDSDGRYDTMDISTDNAVFGEGTLLDQNPFQTGVNDDERKGIGYGGGNSGGSAEVRLGLHVFTVSFDNNPAAPADSDDARLMARWYVGTLDGLSFVQVSPPSNGLYTVLEFDANANGSYDAGEVLSTTPATISIGGSQSSLAYRSNPTAANSVTLSGSSAAAPAQVAPPSSDQAGTSSNVQNPPASQVLAQEAEKAREEADAQDGPESKQPIPPQAAEPPPARVARDISNQPLARDEVVVSLSPDLPDPERRIRQIAFATGATILGSVAATRTYQLQYEVGSLAALDNVIAHLEGFTGVASASHHYLLDELARTPNDSKYPDWGEGPGDGWDMRIIRLPEAWETNTGRSLVKVAVLDADFDRNHEDLRGNIASISAPKPTKAGGHGTHVSGTICAKGDNTIGVAGVVWDCSLSLYDFGGASPVKAQEAMIAAVQSGARIINMSLQWVDNNQCGTVGTPATSRKVEEINNILKGALDYAKNNRRDVLWVFAAGNECRDTQYASPASLARKYPDNVIVVSSIGPSGDLSYFSNYGDLVTVVAPGEDILSTLPNNDYGLLSGTSMATPHVSGLAALIMSRNSRLTAAQVKQCIVGSAQPSSRSHRYKLVNAAEAMNCGEGVPPSRPPGVYGGG